MPDGGRLTIETGNAYIDEEYAAANDDIAPGQYVLLSVTDTGTGMTPEVAERAFDPFFTTKDAGKGTGLGLSQVYGFVKQSGGHVKIYTERGVGSTIKIYLPRHAGGRDIATNDSGSSEMPVTLGQGEVILVVEDDEKVRIMSADALQDLGYSVLQAENAERALAIISTNPQIDLLFTDVVMPDMNGRKLADRAKEIRPELKVLFTTGYTRNAIVHSGTLDRDVALVSKPFTLNQLATKVRAVIDGGK
jgi:CheY-like chemotaxis protein